MKKAKKKVMSNKHKLKGENIFIENNLSWKVRKVQSKINLWVRKQRENRLEMKVGLGRVRVKGVWRAWVEIEKDRKEDKVE